jgi:hypothetical protein
MPQAHMPCSVVRWLTLLVLLQCVSAMISASDDAPFPVPAEFEGEPTEADRIVLEVLEQELKESATLTNLYKQKRSQLQELRRLYVDGVRGGVTPHELSGLLHTTPETSVRQYMVQRAALTATTTITATAVATFVQRSTGVKFLVWLLNL